VRGIGVEAYHPGYARARHRERALTAAVAVFLLAGPAACRKPPPATWVEPVTGMEFVLIRSGEFTMGSPASEIAREAGETLHRVRITRDYYLGRREVAQEAWTRVMGSNPSRFADCGPSCPVESVDDVEIHDFIARLAALSGAKLRLPTEAEWEIACRAGTTTPFSTGSNLTTEEANYDGRYPYGDHAAGIFRARTTPTGSFPPNPWGLFDMHGNVWEWCEDDDCPYAAGEAIDPLGACGSLRKIIRGGSWVFGADSARCALRYTHAPQDKGYSLGFRLVHEP
jgi:formylglycine-generating enzyme required for sulfatase activity